MLPDSTQPSTLKTRTTHGVFWSFIDAIGARLVQFLIGVILARLLLPEQFGLIGMLVIFMAIAQSLLDSGFAAALIQKKELTKVDASSVFYFNVAISLTLAGLLYLAAPLVSTFYNQPILVSMTRALSLMIVINSFSVVQMAMLTRRIDFKTQTKVSLVAGIGSGVIGITLAYTGFGVWGLVAQQISAALFRAILLWVFNRWRPGWVFSVQALRQMFRFGSRMLVSGLLNQVFDNIYFVVIGRLFSPAALGFYTRAKRLEELPSMTLSSIITRVSFPVFSSIQDDNPRLKRALRKSLAMLVFMNAPIMVGLAVVARPLVVVLLTEKWLPSVPYLQLLCVLGLILPLHILNLNLLMAKGRSDLFLRLEIIKKVFVILNIVIMWRWGIVALILGQIILSCLSYLLNSYYTGKFLDYHAPEQIRDVGIYFVSAALMGAGVYLLAFVPFPNDLLLLLSQVVTGGVLYLLLSILFRPPAFLEAQEVLRDKLPAVKAKMFDALRICLFGRSNTL